MSYNMADDFLKYVKRKNPQESVTSNSANLQKWTGYTGSYQPRQEQSYLDDLSRDFMQSVRPGREQRFGIVSSQDDVDELSDFFESSGFLLSSISKNGYESRDFNMDTAFKDVNARGARVQSYMQRLDPEVRHAAENRMKMIQQAGEEYGWYNEFKTSDMYRKDNSPEMFGFYVQGKRRDQRELQAVEESRKADLAYQQYLESGEYKHRAGEYQPIPYVQQQSGAAPDRVPFEQTQEGKKASELKHKSDYWKGQMQGLKDEKVLLDDLAEYQTWPEEDKKLMQEYADHRAGGAGTIMGQASWQFFLSERRLGQLGEKYGYEKVDNIAESLTRFQNAQGAQQIAEKTEQWTENLPGAAGHSVLSVGANVVNAVTGPMGYLNEMLGRTGRYSTLDPNNGGTMFGKYAGGVRGNIGENLQEYGAVGEVGNILYQGGMSALDSIARIAVGGETMALGLAATGSFADTVSDASARGVDPFHATVMGIVDGGLEVITEKVSLDNLLDDVAKAPLNAKEIFKAAAIQGGIEVSEEEASLFGSLLAESIILRDQSEYNQTISKLMVENGMSLDDAKAVANRNIVHEAAVTALESFASGAMMSGGEQAIAKGQYNQAVRKSGKAVNKARGGSNALLAMADRLAEGSTPETMTNVQQKAEAYRQAVDGKKPSGRKANMAAGELQVAISESIRAQGQSDLEKSLTRKGYTPESAKNMAEALVAYSNGDRLTGSQKALVASAKKSPKTMRAIADTLNNPKSTAGHKNVELAAFQVAARSNSIEKAGQIADMAQNPEKYIQKDLADVDEYQIGDDIKFSDDGKAHVAGEAVEIQEITSAADGKMEVQLANGETVDVDQIEHASEDDAIVYTAVARIAPDAKTANQLIADYRGGQVSARDYAMGIQQAYDFGAHNIRTDELLTADLASKLEPNQRLTAYKAGEAGGIRQLAMEKEIANKRTAPKGYKGGVDLSYVKTERSKWNAKQETAVQTWEKIAAITGTRFVAFESYEDGRKKGSRSFVNPVTGQVEQDAPHGFYKDGAVYVDLNAGNNAEGAMLWTTGHELAHHIRAWSPEKFKMLADVLVDFYGKTNRSVDEMVRDQIALAKRDNRTLTYDEAFEEFVADNLQAVLRDGKVVEMMTAVKAKDQTLWQKIKDFFTNLKEDLKKLIDAYKNSDPYTAEGKIAANSQALLDQLEPIFAEGLMEAGDNIATAPEAMDIEDSTEAVAVQETVKHSYRSLAEAAGFEAVEEDGSRYFTRDGQRVSEVTISDIDNSPIGAMINYSLEMGDLGKGKKAEDLAQRQKQMFVDVCNMAIQTNDFGMAMQFMGSAVFTGMKANADKQYNTTYDFPSICTKTQAIIDSMSARMVAMGRGLTEQEIVGLYNDTFASGNPVPCPECYVFSRWIGIGGLLDKISTFQKEYGDMMPEQVAARYRKMHAEIEEYVAEKNAEVAEWNKTHKGDDQKKEITFGRAKGSKASKLAKQHDDLVEKIEKDQDAGRTVKKSDLDKLKTLKGIMNTVNGLTWIEKVYFKDKAMTKKNPRAFVPNEILFDLNKGEMFAAQYPEAWGFRTTQGAGYGKAITPYAEARLGEGIMVTNNTSKTIKTKAKDKLDIKNPFLQQHGQMDKAAKRILATARQKQLNQAFIGGQRFQSTSDARYENASDYLLAALEMQATHGRVQVYTKVDGAVPAFANWGFSINQSLMPKGGGLDADGNVIDTDTGGMKKAVAVENRMKYETAGTITIGVNDNHIRAMFQQVIRDFIIPYHASGGKANLVTRFREIQEGKGNKTKMVRSTDYSRTQSDKILSDQVLEWMGKSQDEIDTIHKNRQARVDILTGGKPDMNVVTNNEYLKRLYEKTHGGPWNGVKLAKSKFEAQIYPNEFWDTSVDYEHSAKITSDYLAYCDSLGFLHRFSGMVPHQGKLIPAKGYNELGERVELTDLAYKYENGHITDEVEDFFWKTLTDRRMYDNSGNYLPQKVVTLNDTTPDTVRNFARNSAGRTYNKEVAEQLAKEIVDKDYSDVDIGGKKAQKILGIKKSTRENLDEKQQEHIERVETSDINTKFSLREEAPPKNVIKAYKVFRVADGKLYPPKIANLTDDEGQNVAHSKDPRPGKSRITATGMDTPIGVWLNADVGGIAVDKNGEAILNENGRIRVYDLNGASADKKTGEVNFKEKATLAFRPGWHLGEYPEAPQFHLGDGSMPDDLVYAECEIAADINYQTLAMSYGVNENGTFLHSQAGLPAVPKDGFYKYKTNPSTDSNPWYITGAMKVTRIIGDAERREICAKHGVKVRPRYSGKDIEPEQFWPSGQPAEATNLSQYKRNSRNDENDALLARTLEKVQKMSEKDNRLGYVQRDINFDDPKIRTEVEKTGLKLEELRDSYEKHGIKPFYTQTGKVVEDVKLSARESNEAYMAAVNSGNMEEAQKLVDEAAKAAGYNTPKLFHGTTKFGFTEFDRSKVDDHLSFFTTSDEDTAQTYSGTYGNRKLSDKARLSTLQDKVDEINKHRDGHHIGLMKTVGKEEGRKEYYYQVAHDKLDNYWEEIDDYIEWSDSGRTDPMVSQKLKDAYEQFNGYDPDVTSPSEDEAKSLIAEVSSTLDKIDRYVKESGHYDPDNLDVDVYDELELADVLKDVMKVLRIYDKGQFALDTDWFTPQIMWEAQLDNLLDLDSGNYALYGKTKKPYIFNAKGAKWNALEIPEIGGKYYVTTREVSEWAHNHGYDSVELKNVRDFGDEGDTPDAPSDVYIFFSPEQLKSADPVTYDDAGNVLPLSERFQDTQKDIRYSQREFRDQVDKVKAGTFDPQQMVYVENTPKKLGDLLGIPRVPVFITNNHLYAAASTEEEARRERRYNRHYHYHGLGWNLVKDIPDIINNPAAIVKSNTDDDDRRFLVVSDREDNEGRRVVFAFAPNGKGIRDGLKLSSNVVLSLYGRNNFHDYMVKARNEGRILYVSKKNSHKNTESPGVQFPNEIRSYDYSANLARFRENVKKDLQGGIFANSGDVRFSQRDPLQVRRSNADQRLIESYRDEIKDLNALVDLQTKDKKGRQVQPRHVSAAARSLIKSGKLTGDYHELADALKPFYDWIVTTDPYTVSTDDIQAKAADAVNWMASHSKVPEDVNRMDLLSDVYDSAWKVKTLLTPADIVADKNRTIAEKQAEIDRIKAAHEKTMQQTEKEWSDEVKAIRAMYQADRETVEKQLRADANARVEATAKKYQEAREKSTEGRHKTDMRHKLQHVVHDLDKLLRNGTKERHVPLGLRQPVALMLDMLDLDTVNADQKIGQITAEIETLQKERDDFQGQLARADSVKKEQLQKSIEVRERKISDAYQRIANLRARDDKMRTRLQELHEAYAKIQDDADPAVRGSYDPVVDALIVQAEESVGHTTLGEMSLPQLQKVYRLYRAMLKTVRDANKAHSERIRETITAMGQNVINELKMNVGSREGSFTALDFIRKFGWQNLRPAQFFKILGSPTLNTLYQEMRAGEDTFAKDIAGAKEFRAQIAAKYGSQDWDMEKLYTFEDATGQEFQLTLQQMMSIYAYRQRGAQALDHFSAGGIVLGPETKHKKKVGGINFDFKPTGSIAYRLPVETVGEIISTMESIEGVKGYVDEMQKYLSNVMGAKGNEVSRALYDMNLFNEEFYFPLRSATDWMARAKTSQEMKNAGFQSIKNKGMTKETKPKAGNPVVLAAFDSVWADHVDEMSIYHAMTLPMEDFGKVYAYHTGYEDEQTGAVVASIADAYGDDPNTYINEFARQLNGGVHVDVNANLLNRGVSKFKKAAVMASASVVAQQYSAIYRAMAVIDPRYFVASTPIRNHKALWEEVKHYAPVAIIKEMGGFDTGVGAGVRDYILAEEYSGVGNKVKAFFKDSQYRDDAFGFLPGYMDEVGWITIWNAAKKQSAAMNPNMDAEEQMRAAANIFTRAVTETQVYDSVFSRSGLMRSKDTGLQMATAFMAEPTVTINMIADALVAHRRGQRKVVGRTLGSILLSTVANAACAALVYAARDDDDDETYTEKYTEAFLSKVMEGLNIMTYIPIARDLMSLVQGYDIERADMAVAADLVKATQAMFSPKVPMAKKLTDFAGSVSSMFGLPTKNILRDLKAVWNVFTIDPGKTTSAGMARAVKAAMLPSWLGFKPEKNDARLYKAVMSGDQEEIRRSMAEFKTEEAAHSALRSQLRENDDRIKKAAELKLAGDAKGFRALFKEIQNEGNFEFDDIMKAINSEVSELKPEPEPKAADPKKQAFYEKYGYTWSQKGDLYDAGGISDSELIQAYVDVEGRTREAATERVTVMHFQKIHPQAEDISYAAIEDFNTFCEPAGVSFDEFWDVKKYYNGIDGPKKEIVMEYINGLPISYEAKTALYFAMGWKESTLDEAPWY